MFHISILTYRDYLNYLTFPALTIYNPVDLQNTKSARFTVYKENTIHDIQYVNM